MTDRLQEIKDRAAKATRPPWVWFPWGPNSDDGRSWEICRPYCGKEENNAPCEDDCGKTVVRTAECDDDWMDENDAAFIANSREDIDYLLEHAENSEAYIKRVERQRDEAQATIARVRAALEVFCHGEQAYAEHAHYCAPILHALDGENAQVPA